MTYPPPILSRVLAWLRPLAASLGPVAARVGRFVGWFLRTQAVTVAALGFIIAALWTVYEPFGLLACGMGLIVLERKVEIDLRAAKET